MTNFGALWIGRPLSKIEIMSLMSHIYNGHKVFLFTYGDVKNVPKEIEIMDGEEVLSKKYIKMFDNSYSNFSDVFRYAMMQKYDMFWTDLDSICLSRDWNFKDDYVFGINDKHNLDEYICTSSFRLPAESEVLAYLKESSLSLDLQNEWAPAGPKLLTSAIFKYNLQNKILPPKAFAPVPFYMWDFFWDSSKTSDIISMTDKSYSLQLWNQMIYRSGIDRDEFPENSYMSILEQKFLN